MELGGLVLEIVTCHGKFYIYLKCFSFSSGQEKKAQVEASQIWGKFSKKCSKASRTLLSDLERMI